MFSIHPATPLLTISWKALSAAPTSPSVCWRHILEIHMLRALALPPFMNTSLECALIPLLRKFRALSIRSSKAKWMPRTYECRWEIYRAGRSLSMKEWQGISLTEEVIVIASPASQCLLPGLSTRRLLHPVLSLGLPWLVPEKFCNVRYGSDSFCSSEISRLTVPGTYRTDIV